MKLSRLAVSIFLLCFFVSTAKADPSEISNQHPLGLMHLSITPQSASPVPAGTMDILFSGAISNTVNREQGDFLFDAETREGALRAQYGITDDLTLSARTALQYRGGGWTDQPIDEWHQFFGLPRGPRKHIPKDEFHLVSATRDGEDFSLSKDGSGFSDLDFQLKYLFWKSSGGESLLSVAPVLRLPAGESTYGQDSIDSGLSILGSTEVEAFTFTAGMSYLYFFDPDLYALRFERNHFGGFLSAEYKFTEAFSGIVELITESAMLANVPKFPDYQMYLDFGVSYRLAEKTAVAFYIRENPTPDDATTDVTLFVSLQMAFAGL